MSRMAGASRIARATEAAQVTARLLFIGCLANALRVPVAQRLQSRRS